jgi:mannan endo-1,4-beta-mannosidase
MIAEEWAGQVQAMCWHWNAPTNLINTVGHEWWRGFYTDSTTFDIAAALANTNSTEYAMVLRDIDAIAVQLKKFASNNIPVLWRPLHESEGGWFWWGAKGPEPFKELWRLLYQRLTIHHGLHNLIWVLTSEDPAWYPGDDVVDVVGVDGYPTDKSDALSGRWQALLTRFDGKKLLALTEFGGVPDIEKMQRFGVWWSWFAPWTGTNGPTAMPNATVIRIYQSPGVVTLDEANAVPPKLLGLTRLADGNMQLTGKGPRGATNRISAATSLPLPPGSWSNISTGKFAGGVFTFSDSQATNNPLRFYRVRAN